MSRLGTETAFEVLARAKALEAKGKHVVHLEIGEPDFDTPRNIVEAAVTALHEGYTHYNPAPGMPEVREAIVAEVNRTRNLKFSADNVVLTPGAKPIMFFVIMALIGEGDEAIYPNPGFPIYESVINFAGGKAVPMPLLEKNDFGMDIDQFESLVTEKTKLIIVNSPHNPTGGILTKEQLKRIAEVAAKRGIWVLTDEVYSRTIYDAPHESITQFPEVLEHTILLDGLSKTYAMTGWRLGYGVMPVAMAKVITQMGINVHSCTSAFAQRAIIEAYGGPQEEPARMTTEFRKRREFIVKGLNEIPNVSCKNPPGAFYVFPNITKTGKTSRQLESELLDEAGVAVLSGTAFGKYGDGHLRLSYANSIDNIKLALDRIAAHLAK
ncbi:MAG: pyridoxal phosphate-dependent aminotransferase [bacterium]